LAAGPNPDDLWLLRCGCQLELNSVAKRKVVKVTTKNEAGVNQGSLCVKGRFGYDFIHHPDRLTKLW